MSRAIAFLACTKANYGASAGEAVLRQEGAWPHSHFPLAHRGPFLAKQAMHR